MRTTAAMTIGARARATDYVALAKPRLNLLVVASTVAGYAMAHGDTSNVAALLSTIIGTALVAGGASAFNQVIERDSDSLMRRTRLRPLPDGRLASAEALTFATVLSCAGLLILAAAVNVLAATVALATLASYAVVYTPLKRRTSFATVIGAIPGALPPVIGWAAAENSLTQGAWVLFGILFLWQLPHFLAIAWMYRDDYARAGLPMLPVIEPDGRSTGAPGGALRGGAAPGGARAVAGGDVGPGVFHGRAGPDAAVPGHVAPLRDDSRRARCATALLRVDHLPAAALGADDRRPHVGRQPPFPEKIFSCGERAAAGAKSPATPTKSPLEWISPYQVCLSSTLR